MKVRNRITTYGQPGKKGRHDREQGGKSETRHEAKITEFKKKIFSKTSAGRAKTMLRRVKTFSQSAAPLPARRSLASPGVSQDLYRAFRQCFKEGSAVCLRHDPIVEDDDDAAVALGPDQTPDPLAEFQDCFRE